MRRALVALAFWMTTTAILPAQESATALVLGAVRNTSGVAVPGAEVTIIATGQRAVSSDSGEFRIEGAPSGRMTVVARRVGFRPDSVRLSLRAGDVKQVKFTLHDMRDELEAVIVSAERGASGRLQEFWAHRMSGLGVFITRADIERRRPSRTADIFRSVVGVRIVSVPGEGARLVTTRRSGAVSRQPASGTTCPMQYYVDGVFLPTGTFSVDELTPDAIEAIEVYRGPAEVPARFRQHDTACGLVVIWTREPPRLPMREP